MSQLVDELKEYVRSGNLQGANQAFLGYLGVRSILDLTEGADLELAAYFLESILPLTLHDHPSLILDNQELANKYRALMDDASILGYGQEVLKQQKLRLRCLEAIGALMRGERDQVLLASEENGFEPLLLSVDFPPGEASYERVEQFFREYFEKERDKEDARIISDISAVVFDLLRRLRVEETVPGIARGLFVDGITGRGEIRRVLARVDLGEGAIEYATLGGEEISDTLKAAAQNAWMASNAYLVANGYVEGLKGRKMAWQITDLDVRAETLKTFYDGASMGLPLAMATISAYLRKPIPSTVAFTGAFDITSARDGRLVKVGGVVNKCKEAIEKGFRFIFLPKGNEVDIDLSLQKVAEREGFALRFIDSISESCNELFGDSRKKSTSEMVREIFANLWGVLTFKPRSPLVKQNLGHIWFTSLLLVAMYLTEGLLVYKVSPSLPVPWSVFHWSVVPACLVVFLGLLLAYVIVPSYLEQQRQESWYVSIVVLGVANVLAYVLFLQMVQGETPDLSRFPDWPAPLGILKDLLIFWGFSTFFLTNLFNYVVTLNFLAMRYQVVTVQNCLSRGSLIDTGAPVKVLAIPWNWAVIIAMIVGALLMTFEMVTYWSLREGVEAARWYIIFGILRDFVFIVLAVEVLIWYRNSITSISRKVSQI